MSQNGRDLGDFAANLRLQNRYHIMRVFEAQCIVELEMLLYVQPSPKILDAHIMDAEFITRSHGTDSIKNVFMAGLTRHGVNDYVHIRQDSTHSARNLRHHLP